MQNRCFLSIFSMAILFSLQSVSFADSESYKSYPAGGGCFYHYNKSTSVWDIDCGSLPEIMVTATRPDDPHIDHDLGTPWFHVDLWQNLRLWYAPAQLWEPVPASTIPLNVYFELKPGQSDVIDCSIPGAGGEQRKRYLIVRTDPVFDDLWITDIIKTRHSAAYGHNHSGDNDIIKCRGATDNDSGVTDENGVYEFFYRGPEAAGETRVTIEWEDPRTSEEQTPRTGSAHLDFINKYDGLQNFTGGTGITLVGANDHHPSNHWSTSATHTLIIDLAAAFLAEYSKNILVNDMSLQYGGLFDCGPLCNQSWSLWDTPHSEHRVGNATDVDINPYDAGQWNFIKDWIDINKPASNYYDHGSHLHVRTDKNTLL